MTSAVRSRPRTSTRSGYAWLMEVCAVTGADYRETLTCAGPGVERTVAGPEGGNPDGVPVDAVLARRDGGAVPTHEPQDGLTGDRRPCPRDRYTSSARARWVCC